MNKRWLPKVCLVGALVTFFVASWGMSREMEPFYTWFYCFAWWSCIVVLESGLAVKGRPSLLFDQPSHFAFLAFLSVPLWCLFEIFNFRLGNWSYVNVPESLSLRWSSYALSYATILPALGAVEAVLLALGLERLKPAKPLLISSRISSRLMAGGALMLALCLAFPRYAFPLLWLGFIPLIDPILRREGQESLQGFLQQGLLWRIGVMALAGLVCGLLWETWNFRAGAKWIYIVPFVGQFKMFEMPILGFLGFLPFALECFVIKEAVAMLWDWPRRPRSLRPATALCAVGFSLLVFWGIDTFTVISFRP